MGKPAGTINSLILIHQGQSIDNENEWFLNIGMTGEAHPAIYESAIILATKIRKQILLFNSEISVKPDDKKTEKDK